MPTRDSESQTGRILVVDDERNIRLTLARALEGMGFGVHTARNGREALGVLRRENLDLALVDLMLPGMDGLTLLRRIRTYSPKLPVIVFTAHGSAEVAAEAIKLGATDFIRKPFTPREIRTLVGRIVESPLGQTDVTTVRAPALEPVTPYRAVVPVVHVEDMEGPLRLAAASAHSHEQGELVAVHVIELPPQTPLDAIAYSDNELRRRQKELLERTRMYALELSIALRARAITGHDAGDAIVNVIQEEQADEVVLAWTTRRDRVFASIISAVTKRAPCEVTLVKGGTSAMHDVVALVGEGPHAAAAVRRAYDCAQSAGIATLTLLNVQTPHDASGVSEETGRRLVHQAASQAQVPRTKYQTRILISRNVREALLEAIDDYDTICVGASRNTVLAQALFGSIPEAILETISGTVAVVRAPQPGARTIIDIIAGRLSGET